MCLTVHSISPCSAFSLFCVLFQGIVFDLSLSPDGDLLAGLDCSGRLTLYDVPSLRVRSVFDCKEQVSRTALDKKRTILEIRGEKNAVPRVISCSITSDQRRARSDPRLSATFALRLSRVIEHDITRGTAFFSP